MVTAVSKPELANLYALFTKCRTLPELERAAFLDREVADCNLRQQIESMLEFDAAPHTLQGPPEELFTATDDMPDSAEAPVTQIGSYKIREKIGEGGFGVVYVAEQTQPVARKVALKIIKPGMDTRDVIARFEVERQALALMDHPNIARVLEAGATDSGRPYFVMELVHGLPITDFCDEQRMGLRARLQLFIDVCRAVQHAHQKGIIHRDLKPSNVMVTMRDDKPTVKVIDFGVSKALSRRLIDKTVYTAYGQMIGTPLYMSPEQAQLNEIDVDTRSDVYSLGVLLYELLTGCTPFETETLRNAGFDEMRRIIREDDPPRPSVRVSTLNVDRVTTAADRRRIDHRRFDQTLRGELDLIVMKALEKDRSRRYESSSAFAADLQRYLDNEPVQACPPSVWYRFRKFARRRRGELTVGIVMAVAALLVVATIGWMVRDRAARDQETLREQAARQARLRTQIETVVEDVDRLMHEQQWSQAMIAARHAESLLVDGEAVSDLSTRMRNILNELQFVEACTQARLSASTWTGTGFDYANAGGQYADAFRHLGIDVENASPEEAIETLKRHSTVMGTITIALDDWAHVRRQHQSDTVARKFPVALARHLDSDEFRNRLRAIWGQAVRSANVSLLKDLARSSDLLNQPVPTIIACAKTLHDYGLRQDAIDILRRTQAAHPGDFWANFELGATLYTRTPTDPEVIRFYSVALGLQPDNTAVLNNLGLALIQADRLQEATTHLERAIEIDPMHSFAHRNLGHAYAAQDSLNEAAEYFRKAIELDPDNAVAYNDLAVTLKRQGNLEDAVELYRAAVRHDQDYAIAHLNLATALEELNRFAEAEHHYEEASKGKFESSESYNTLGVYHKRRKAYGQAIQNFEQAINMDNNNIDAYYNLGIVHGLQGNYEEAIDAYQRVIERKPDDWQAAYQIGVIKVRQERLLEAVVWFERSIEFAPQPQASHWSWDEAVLCFTRLADLSGKESVDPYIAGVRNILQLATQSAFVHANAAKMFAGQGRMDEAISHFRVATSLDPEFAAAHSELAWHLATAADATLRNPAEAVRHAREAKDLKPDNPNHWDNLGVALYRNGEWQEAATVLETAREMRDGSDPQHQCFLAMAYWKLKRTDDALRELQEADCWLNETQRAECQYRFRDEAHELIEARDIRIRNKRNGTSPTEKASQK